MRVGSGHVALAWTGVSSAARTAYCGSQVFGVHNRVRDGTVSSGWNEPGWGGVMQGLQDKTLCVYCGARPGTNPVHADQARDLGVALAKLGGSLVYGGGSVGLMGVVSTAVIDAGGRVTGVIPEHLYSTEMAHGAVQSLEVVASMHVRKNRMIELADAIVALPGGIGTLEELAEALTWRQLGLHAKPLAVVDSDGYYSDLFATLESMVDHGFADLDVLSALRRFDTPDDLLQAWVAGTWG
ncbi:MAG: TIGR00730 family Rossman fold protein [Pseudomonadota bacterium]